VRSVRVEKNRFGPTTHGPPALLIYHEIQRSLGVEDGIQITPRGVRIRELAES
jgi:hypothetical protein